MGPLLQATLSSLDYSKPQYNGLNQENQMMMRRHHLFIAPTTPTILIIMQIFTAWRMMHS